MIYIDVTYCIIFIHRRIIVENVKSFNFSSSSMILYQGMKEFVDQQWISYEW